MKDPNRFQEPLFSIILKALAILSLLAAGIYFVSIFTTEKLPDNETIANITRLENELELRITRTTVALGSAISVWWMAEVICLLAKIADGRGAKPSRKELEAMMVPARRAREEDDDGIPKYQL
jgi:hypothetical protein